MTIEPVGTGIAFDKVVAILSDERVILCRAQYRIVAGTCIHRYTNACYTCAVEEVVTDSTDINPLNFKRCEIDVQISRLNIEADYIITGTTKDGIAIGKVNVIKSVVTSPTDQCIGTTTTGDIIVAVTT